jgi:hypothetical protein
MDRVSPGAGKKWVEKPILAAVLCFSIILVTGCGSPVIPDTGLNDILDTGSTLSQGQPFNFPDPPTIPTYTPYIHTPIYSAPYTQQATSMPHPYPSPEAHLLSPTHTASPTIAPTASPSLTPTPTPIPTPFRLTEGGCCPHPFWSSASDAVYFIGSPYSGSEAGLWRIALEEGEPDFITPIAGIYSPDVSLAAFPVKGQTFIERLETGEIWMVPTGGRKVHFSPDGSQIAWTAWELVQGKRFLRPIWVSQPDGTHAQEVTAMYGWGFIDWFPDGRLLVHGRFDYTEEFNAYWIVTPGDGSLTELVRGFRLTNGSVSPDGRWVAYHNVLDPRSEENGLWVIDTKTLDRAMLDIFGPFQWRTDGRLVVVPLDVGSNHHNLIEIDVESGVAADLTDPEAVPLKIAGGDWMLSPDGRWLAFISAHDFNIWVLALPENKMSVNNRSIFGQLPDMLQVGTHPPVILEGILKPEMIR